MKVMVIIHEFKMSSNIQGVLPLKGDCVRIIFSSQRTLHLINLRCVIDKHGVLLINRKVCNSYTPYVFRYTQ